MSREEVQSDLQIPWKDEGQRDLVEVVRKPIRGYDGYYRVDQFGRVFSDDRTIHVVDNGREYDKFIAGKQMKQRLHSNGYKTVDLTKDGTTKRKYVHRLVAEAFIQNPDNLPFINHKDEDKTNNFVENLEWCTNEYNVNYGSAIDRARKKKIGIPHTQEHNSKIAESLRNYYKHHEPKHKGKISPKRKPIVGISPDGEVRSFTSATEAAMILNGSQTNISAVCRGRKKTAYGYKWMFEDDYCGRGERRDV